MGFRGRGSISTSAIRGTAVTARRLAFIPPSPGVLPGDLLGGEDRAFAADPLWDARRAHHHAPEACSDGAAHVLLHRDLEEGLAAGSGRADLGSVETTFTIQQPRLEIPIAAPICAAFRASPLRVQTTHWVRTAELRS